MVLDWSKVLSYKFSFSYMMTENGDRAKVVYTDVDSFLFKIFTDDFYKDIVKMLKYFLTRATFQRTTNLAYPQPLIIKRLAYLKAKWVVSPLKNLQHCGERKKEC